MVWPMQTVLTKTFYYVYYRIEKSKMFLGLPTLPKELHVAEKPWMYNYKFLVWLFTWYAEVRTRSEIQWLLLLDKFCGYAFLPIMDGVTFWFLPPRTTSTF